MAQPLQSINLVAPAFKGINTEDSPLAQDPSFADIADNAVIDNRGRIAARKGLDTLTVDKTELGSDYVHSIHEFYDESGNEKIFSFGNNKILSGVETLVDETPVGYGIASNDWRTVNFNNAAYFFQRGHEPLIYTEAGGLQTFSAYEGHAVPQELWCHEGLAAYGRIWVTDSEVDTHTIYWSDLLNGTDFSSGSSGSIDISEAWPDGSDSIVSLVAHNNFLIIFGEHSIVVYGGADSPANMAIADTVAGVGCIDRNSVQHIGTDVLFLDDTGLKSFSRVIQEKSMPISDLSGNVKTEFIETIRQHEGPVSTLYSSSNTFYLVSFPDIKLTYCFDIKGKTENGSFRVTRWPSSSFFSFETLSDGRLLVGNTFGISEYKGYADNGSPYRFRYYSPGLTFGDPSRLKMLKKLRPTIIGANEATIFLKWSYDFETYHHSTEYTVGSQVPAYYNIDEYTDGEYTSGQLISRRSVNGSGDGTVINIGLETNIYGDGLSLQEINVLALMGKML